MIQELDDAMERGDRWGLVYTVTLGLALALIVIVGYQTMIADASADWSLWWGGVGFIILATIANIRQRHWRGEVLHLMAESYHNPWWHGDHGDTIEIKPEDPRNLGT